MSKTNYPEVDSEVNESILPDKLKDEWEIIDDEVGGGAYGKVYKIAKKNNPELVSALKIVKFPADKEEAMQLEQLSEKERKEVVRRRLTEYENEGRILARLKGNSRIVPIEDYDPVENEDGCGFKIYIRYEWQEEDLRKTAIKNSDIASETKKVGVQICEALSACENENIAHRDIKPDNIFRTKDGSYKLGDFGVAKIIEDNICTTRRGTPYYNAPEIEKMNGSEGYNGTLSDIYSLGLVMYWFINDKRMPFMEKNIAGGPAEGRAYELRINREELPKPEKCPDTLWKIIKKALSYNPRGRFQSAKEMKDALENMNVAKARAESKEILYSPLSLVNMVNRTAAVVLGEYLEICMKRRFSGNWILKMKEDLERRMRGGSLSDKSRDEARIIINKLNEEISKRGVDGINIGDFDVTGLFQLIAFIYKNDCINSRYYDYPDKFEERLKHVKNNRNSSIGHVTNNDQDNEIKTYRSVINGLDDLQNFVMFINGSWKPEREEIDEYVSRQLCNIKKVMDLAVGGQVIVPEQKNITAHINIKDENGKSLNGVDYEIYNKENKLVGSGTSGRHNSLQLEEGDYLIFFDGPMIEFEQKGFPWTINEYDNIFEQRFRLKQNVSRSNHTAARVKQTAVTKKKIPSTINFIDEKYSHIPGIRFDIYRKDYRKVNDGCISGDRAFRITLEEGKYILGINEYPKGFTGPKEIELNVNHNNDSFRIPIERIPPEEETVEKKPSEDELYDVAFNEIYINPNHTLEVLESLKDEGYIYGSLLLAFLLKNGICGRKDEQEARTILYYTNLNKNRSEWIQEAGLCDDQKQYKKAFAMYVGIAEKDKDDKKDDWFKGYMLAGNYCLRSEFGMKNRQLCSKCFELASESGIEQIIKSYEELVGMSEKEFNGFS